MFITCSHCGDVRYAIKATMKRKMCTKQKFRKSPKFYCAIDYCICGKLYVAFKKFYVLLKRIGGMSAQLKWMQQGKAQQNGKHFIETKETSIQLWLALYRFVYYF